MRRWLAIALALLWAVAALAQGVLPVPALDGRVIDQTATLSAAEREALAARLAAFEAESGPQIVVLLVPTTQPEDIAAYAQRVADQWKIGRRQVGDGVLVVVAKNDRRVRIEVAKALEGAIPDLAARQIIDGEVRDAFRAGDYARGLNGTVDRLEERIRGEHLPAPEAVGGAAPQQGLQLHDLGMFLLVAVPIIGIVLARLFGRKLGTLLAGAAAGGLGWVLTASVLVAVGAAVVAFVFVGLMNLGSALRRLGGGPSIGPFGGGWSGGGGGWSGGGGGGSDGGAFSSGGGGDFGGGGASGDW